MASILKHSRIGLIALATITIIIRLTRMSAIVMYGKMTTIIMKTEIVLKPTNVHMLNIVGRIMSKVVMSFENLVKILPIGFESKNMIFDLIILFTIALCKLVVLTTNILRIMIQRKYAPII